MNLRCKQFTILWYNSLSIDQQERLFFLLRFYVALPASRSTNYAVFIVSIAIQKFSFPASTSKAHRQKRKPPKARARSIKCNLFAPLRLYCTNAAETNLIFSPLRTTTTLFLPFYFTIFLVASSSRSYRRGKRRARLVLRRRRRPNGLANKRPYPA